MRHPYWPALVAAAGVALDPFWLEPAAAAPPIRDPSRAFQMTVRNARELSRQHVVMQEYDYSCGAASLATLIRYYWGDDVTEKRVLFETIVDLKRDELRDRVKNGLSMTDLRLGAVRMGYVASIGKRNVDDLYKLKVPVIVRLIRDDFKHFVVLRGIVEDRVFLADPIRGNVRMPLDQFVSQWNEGRYYGGAVLVVAKLGVDKLPENAPLLVRHDPCLPVQHELQAARRALFVADYSFFHAPGRR
jgi:hypothetical protein